MKARGATAPLSVGFLEINTKRERRAEKSVGGPEGMTRVGVGAGLVGTSDAGFPRSNLRRGGTDVAVGNVGCVCRHNAAGTGGAEMSVD